LKSIKLFCKFSNLSCSSFNDSSISLIDDVLDFGFFLCDFLFFDDFFSFSSDICSLFSFSSLCCLLLSFFNSSNSFLTLIFSFIFSISSSVPLIVAINEQYSQTLSVIISGAI